MAKKTTIKTIEQNDDVSLYSICFNGDELSEYEKFLTMFKDNARLNHDFQTIKSGAISIENNVITGIDTATFEL